jgi:predicted TIM-barrel fold metal-dependent hydrolase
MPYREYFESGRAEVMGEVLPQFMGLFPADESLDPYFALTEELDIPVVLHMGDGIP